MLKSCCNGKLILRFDGIGRQSNHRIQVINGSWNPFLSKGKVSGPCHPPLSAEKPGAARPLHRLAGLPNGQKPDNSENL